jgi:sec-independent protein translocase protein TatA
MKLLVFLEFLSAGHLVLIVLALLLLFGGKKIPELMRGLGEGVREFKKASRTDEEKADENTKKAEKQ